MAANLNNFSCCCADPCCTQRPKLSVGVVYPNGMVELANGNTGLTNFNNIGIDNLCGTCIPSCGTGPCCEPNGCRPRLSIGVVYPDGYNNDYKQPMDLTNLCGSCGPCSSGCRPKLSIGVVYSNEANENL